LIFNNAAVGFDESNHLAQVARQFRQPVQQEAAGRASCHSRLASIQLSPPTAKVDKLFFVEKPTRCLVKPAPEMPRLL